jgi:methionyl-tRNA synthetase
MTLAQEANRYLEEKSPWKVIKTDKQAAAVTLYVALTVISGLRTAFYPFLPFSSQKLHEYLGFEERLRMTAGNCVSRHPDSSCNRRSNSLPSWMRK